MEVLRGVLEGLHSRHSPPYPHCAVVTQFPRAAQDRSPPAGTVTPFFAC